LSSRFPRSDLEVRERAVGVGFRTPRGLRVGGQEPSPGPRVIAGGVRRPGWATPNIHWRTQNAERNLGLVNIGRIAEPLGLSLSSLMAEVDKKSRR
jgi:hypothetical protein